MNIKIFIVAFLVSLPFWCGINILEKNLGEIFYWQEITQNPQLLTAQLSQQILEEKLRDSKPFKKPSIENLEIQAKAGISVHANQEQNKERILFKKNSGKKLPIASLSKLMTAYAALEHYNLEETIIISKEAVNQEGNFGKLNPGDKLRVKDLLYIILMESSNDAAYALAEAAGQEGFIALMNLEAKKMGLHETKFFNPTGLDPDNLSEQGNYSTCEDLVKFIAELLKKPLIWEILSLPEFDLYLPNGTFHHQLENTNELLKPAGLATEENQQPKWSPKIIGGKTGWTPEARGCLILVLQAPKQSGYLINVILGSQDRFEEMKKLTDWVYQSHKW